MKSMLFGMVLVLSTQLVGQVRIPPGTVLPLMLSSSLISNKSTSGEVLRAVITQDVPLTTGETIRAGSKVTGRVVNSGRTSAAGGAEISFEFDTITFSKSSPVPLSVLYHSIFDRKSPRKPSRSLHI